MSARDCVLKMTRRRIPFGGIRTKSSGLLRMLWEILSILAPFPVDFMIDPEPAVRKKDLTHPRFALFHTLATAKKEG